MYNLIGYSDNYSKISGLYGNTKEMTQFCLMLALLLIFQVIELRLNLNKK